MCGRGFCWPARTLACLHKVFDGLLRATRVARLGGREGDTLEALELRDLLLVVGAGAVRAGDEEREGVLLLQNAGRRRIGEARNARAVDLCMRAARVSRGALWRVGGAWSVSA